MGNEAEKEIEKVRRMYRNPIDEACENGSKNCPSADKLFQIYVIRN